jgi:nitroimidazol reductase NimA-like FMN-containing flavoprotein (pyridoxamine 5'-phosphate oxidase superfamily)
MQTDRTRLRRQPDRGSYDTKQIHAILDEALICHVGFQIEGAPMVLPTIHGRVGDELYLHGAAANRMLGCLADGAPCCVTATLIDGLVLARSAFHHSMNYRSVVVLGQTVPVTDDAEKRRALDAIVNHVVSNRMQACRPPNETEIRITQVLRLPINEASAKIRTGPPIDDESDYSLPYWAGVAPLHTVIGDLQPDARLVKGAQPPDVSSLGRTGHVPRRDEKQG